MVGGIRLRIPATSANLGPGFDALGLAMELYLTIEARVAESFSVHAEGRDAGVCGDVDTSLVVSTYRSVATGGPALAIQLDNQIPLGMGCGSSAAALLAGVILANHFGELGWTAEQIVTEACLREGHPDNVAAAWHGGMTCSAIAANSIVSASLPGHLKWRLMIVMPAACLPTAMARALVPSEFNRRDIVANIQRTGLLVAAFALGRGELLREAMADRLHQPYRLEVCPLLERLLPLNSASEILGAALSGAGPSVLLIVDQEQVFAAERLVRERAAGLEIEVVWTRIAEGTACALL